MKNAIRCLIFVLVLLCAFSGQVFAEDNQFQEQIDEFLDSSGANELFSIVPDDAKDILEEAEINDLSHEKLINISFMDFIKSIWESIKNTVNKPLSMFLTCVGIILLYALLNSLKSSFNNQSYEHVFSVVSIICLSSAIIIPISNIIIKIAGLIKQVSNFLLSFIPVYMGILTASGKPISATAYSTTIIVVIQIISRISSTVLVPLLAIYMAFCLIGAASNQINVEGIAKTVKTFVTVVLTFLLTIFVGLLTIQGVVSNSADTVTMRTAKFAVSAFLPVVGAAISEALNSVQGCLGIIKSTVGGFGIVALIAAFVPSIVTILMMQLSLSLSGGVSDALGTNKVSSLIRCANSVLSLILGITLIFAVLLIVSIGIMLTVSSGG